MTVLDLIFYFFLGVFFIQTLFYFGLLSLFSFSKPKKQKGYDIAVSVIVCAKNEAENLKENLPKIINQDYKDFEVVLINDSSSDDSLDIMKDFEAKHKNIKIVDVKSTEPFWGNKKYALTLGIKASKHEFLLFTDADCEPASNQWLKEMVSHFSNETSIILGYGAYKKVKYSFLNALIRYETILTAVQYFSFTKLGIPYMGVGRNLAYRKEVFFQHGGFMNHMHLRSGDDDLFINEVANKNNTAICFSEESFTYSEPKKTFKNWIIQKRRHVSTSKYYKPYHKILLCLIYSSQLLFWVLGAFLLTFLYQWQIVTSIIGFRIILQWITLGFSARKLGSKDIIFFIPIIEIFLILFQLVIFSANIISKPRHWK